jgi:hypothetical protein
MLSGRICSTVAGIQDSVTAVGKRQALAQYADPFDHECVGSSGSGPTNLEAAAKSRPTEYSGSCEDTAAHRLELGCQLAVEEAVGAAGVPAADDQKKEQRNPCTP